MKMIFYGSIFLHFIELLVLLGVGKGAYHANYFPLHICNEAVFRRRTRNKVVASGTTYFCSHVVHIHENEIIRIIACNLAQLDISLL